MTDRFWLTRDNGSTWAEVDKATYVNAERSCGFHNTLGQPQEPATASFGAGDIRGTTIGHPAVGLLDAANAELARLRAAQDELLPLVGKLTAPCGCAAEVAELRRRRDKAIKCLSRYRADTYLSEQVIAILTDTEASWAERHGVTLKGRTSVTIEDLDAALARIDQAHDHVCEIALGRARWKASIPAKPETDSDLLLSTALGLGRMAVEELKTLREQLTYPAALYVADENGVRLASEELDDEVSEPQFGSLSPSDIAAVYAIADGHFPNPNVDLPVDEELTDAEELALLRRQRDAVLAYTGKIECGNCDHAVDLHDNRFGTCMASIDNDELRLCGCDWSSSIAEDIRDLLSGRPGSGQDGPAKGSESDSAAPGRPKRGERRRDGLAATLGHPVAERCPGCGRTVAQCSSPLAEPPDGTRLEFESGTDVHAVWRDDKSSKRAGYPTGDGGETWCLYGHTVPTTWRQLQRDFGTCALGLSVRLVPDPRDVPRHRQWPTEVYARTGKWPESDSAAVTPVGAGERTPEGLGTGSGLSDMGGHHCPNCSTPTVYAPFSGGEEYYCPTCQDNGMYPEGAAPPRVQMIADGRFDELRTEMREEMARRKAQSFIDADGCSQFEDGVHQTVDGTCPCGWSAE